MITNPKAIVGQSILYVMAAEQEYGPHLKARINPLITGVGPIEAAISLTAEMTTLKARDSLPDMVVALGSAGSATLEQTEIYQASHLSWRDMDASAIGFEKGVTPFLDHPAVVALAHQIDGLPKARLSTGANIVAGKAYKAIDADMVDMESFALWRVCEIFGVPLVVLRGISDGADDLHHIDGWTEYLHVIDEKLASALDVLEREMVQE